MDATDFPLPDVFSPTGQAAPGGPEVVVIGAGVAGASVALFAARRGARVTVIDAGEGTASRVPSALVNPVRGQNGHMDVRAPEGLRVTWSLVEGLVALGHDVPHARTGVWRPVPDARTQERWRRNLGEALPHRWDDPANVPGLAPGWHAALSLPHAGWLDGGAFVDALLAQSGAARRPGRVTGLTARSVTLSDGEVLEADRVVWCGGSFGAGLLDGPTTHRSGTLLRLDRSPVDAPLSFGGYVAPARTGGVIGATFETPTPRFSPGAVGLGSLTWLLERAERLLADRSAVVTGAWWGSRLSGERCGVRPDGVWTLGGLGSKGFLLGPLLARALVDDLLDDPASASGV